jgi:hypothetical protein
MATSERWCFIGNSKLGLLAIWACGRFRNEHFGRVFGCKFLVWVPNLTIGVVFGQMWIGTLNLNKAFATNRLVAASGAVQVWWIGQEADGTIHGVFVNVDFEWLAIDKGVVGQA